MKQKTVNGSEISCMGYMQVCNSLHTDDHASTLPQSFFTVRMPFLPPNQQRQSTEGTVIHTSETTNIASELRHSSTFVVRATAACPIQTNFLRQTLFQHCSTICLELSPCLRSEL